MYRVRDLVGTAVKLKTKRLELGTRRMNPLESSLVRVRVTEALVKVKVRKVRRLRLDGSVSESRVICIRLERVRGW